MTAERLLAGMSTTRQPQASVLAGGDYAVTRKLFDSLEDLQYNSRTSTCRHVHYTTPSGVSSGRWRQRTVARKHFGSLEDLQYDSKTSTV